MLSEWGSVSYLYPTWKDFYENHLGKWGYDMGELFIFADHNTAKDSFVGASNEKGQIKVHFSYNVGADEYYGPESEILEYTYVLIQTDGKWLINEILYEQ